MPAPEAPSTKRWYDVLVSLTPLILGVCVTGIGALFTQVYNNRQLQLNQLSALDKFRPLLVSENPYDREFAYASFVALGYEDLALKLMRLKQDSAGRPIAQSITIAGSASAKSEASAALSSIPAQVYIQIASESQREKAKEILIELQQRGYSVPGIENVAGKADSPKRTNVRYFNDQDRAVAESIVQVLKDKGMGSAYALRVSHLKARPGSLEVWFAPDLT